ncbi:hypothetical protein [Paenibacillus taihuensis]|uniref:hypothetical protein n=1 Tax=Paenibacillus taihuensis TaxID=1156355 RepID=UPI0011C022D5|nr:hypothetical protein [Paenibacillus taihuensis]
MIIYDAAKSVDPDITIIYYGIHSLMRSVSDLVNLDDLGDAGDSAEHEAAGHNQRCLIAGRKAWHGGQHVDRVLLGYPRRHPAPYGRRRRERTYARRNR